jgi:hypothetical protein
VYMKLLKINLLSLIITLTLTPIISVVTAQDGVYGPIINATTFEYVIEKGSSITDSFEVRHDYQDANFVAVLYPTPVDFTADGESGAPVFLDKTRSKGKSSLEDWIIPITRSITLNELGDTALVEFQIEVPIDAEPGSYTAGLLLSDSEFDPQAGPNQVALESRLGPLVFVTVPGNIQSNLEVLSFEAVDIYGNAPFLGVFEYHPIDFKLTLKNDGNVYMTPGGTISVHQGDLAKASFVIPNLNEEKGSILAGTTRSYINRWNDSAFRMKSETDTSTGQVSYSFDFHPEALNKIRVGRYTATLQLFYRDKATGENIRMDYDIHFWVIPWKVILLIIAAIVAYYMIKKQIKKQRTTVKKSKNGQRIIGQRVN